jgi:hypothetical protein
VRSLSADRASPSDGAVLGRGFARFAQLLAVGFAWGGPLLFAVFAGFGLGTYTHPEFAPLFAHRGWVLLAAMLVLACLGIAIVASLMRHAPRVRLIWLLVPAGLALVAAAPFVAPGRSLPVFFLFSLAAMAVPILVVSLGAAVTTVTLWRRSHWLGIAWPSCWLAGVVTLLYTTEETADSGGLGEGFVVFPVVAALVVVIVLVATLASVLCGVSDWTEQVGRIEQAHQPDKPRLES